MKPTRRQVLWSAAALAAAPRWMMAAEGPARFFLPENPRYTIFDSVADSLRFTMGKCLTTYKGHTCATSSFVDPAGKPMLWHDFGPLEGPGWAANAAGGAYELMAWGRFVGDAAMEKAAGSILDHVLHNGFLDPQTGFIRGYRHIPSNSLVLNFKRNNDWFCPGSNAKVAVQLLLCADLDAQRRDALQRAALLYVRWIDAHLKPLENGWFPRRCTPEGGHYTKAAEGGNDKFFARSADPLFILQLWAELTARKLGDYRKPLAAALRAFQEAGPFYASINHDTYDPEENVAISVAFRVFRRAAQVLEEGALLRYGLEKILPRLERFKMREDRNGVATSGLLYMEDSWDTAYLWENAEAALAFLEAYGETKNPEHLSDGLTILRACAKHHHGKAGFLTEGVDWNNHVGQQHHIDGRQYGAIQYTEPFLNNQHIVEPTLYYLMHHAAVEKTGDGGRVYRDPEGIVVARLK